MTTDEFRKTGDDESVGPQARGSDCAPMRRQFGIRKLLLWTVLVALWCATITACDHMTEWAAWTTWIAVVVVARILLGRRASERSGGIVLAIVAFAGFCVDRYPDLARRAVLGEWVFEAFLALWLAAISYIGGLLAAILVNAVIDWIDSLDRRLAGKRK